MRTSRGIRFIFRMLGIILLAGTAHAAPQLSVSRFAYLVTQVQPVNGNPRAFDVTARVGVLNSGDPAVDVSARLASSHPEVQVLDGDVIFGDVPRTRAGRPAISRDTFALRITVPRLTSLSQLLTFVKSLHESLVWQTSCSNCGAVNRAPLAHAGPDQTIHVSQQATLNGGGSSDPDGQPLTYAWSLVSRPPGSTAVLSNATGVQPTFTADREGDYVASLIVFDGQLSSAPDTVQISTLNSPPSAHAGADQNGVVGQALALDGSGSTDMDGDPLTYEWSVVSRPAGSIAEIVDPSRMLAQFTPDLPGQYLIELTVHDGFVSSAPDTLAISTTAANRAPLANAGPDQTAILNQLVALDGTASTDPDGDTLNYRWSLIARPPESFDTLLNPETPSPGMLVDRPGVYVAQLIVNDGTVDSPADTVSISTVNSPPFAYAGDGGNFLVGTRVQLDGILSGDADNDPLSFAWSLLSTPDGSAAALDDPSIINPSFVVDVAGAYAVQLVVNDGTVDSEPSTTTVIGENVPIPVDSDSDGIPDSVENGAPNNGDGNNDGIPDVGQLNVASLPNRVDGQYVTLVSAPGSSLANVRSVANPSPTDSPVGLAFPWGLFEFEIRNLATPYAQLNIILPASAAPTSYWKYGPVPGNETPHWYEFLFHPDEGNGAELDANVVTLSFVDNERGDDDRATLGVIIDQGGPTVPFGLVARAGADQAGYARIPMTLDGSASSDDQLAPAAFEWNVIDAPPDSRFLGMATPLSEQATFEFKPDAYGTYLLRLTVTGASGAQASDDVLLVAQPRGVIVIGNAGQLRVGQHLQRALFASVDSLVPGEPSIVDPVEGVPLIKVKASGNVSVTLDPTQTGGAEVVTSALAPGVYVQSAGPTGSAGAIDISAAGFLEASLPTVIDPAAYTLIPGESFATTSNPNLPIALQVNRVDPLTGRAVRDGSRRSPISCSQPSGCSYTPPQFAISNPAVGSIRNAQNAITTAADVPAGAQSTAIGDLTFVLSSVGDTVISISSVPGGFVTPAPDTEYDSRMVINTQATQLNVFGVVTGVTPAVASPGDDVVFTVEVIGEVATLLGDIPATDVRVYLQLRGGLTLRNHSATKGNLDVNSMVWHIGDLGTEHVTLTLTARANNQFFLGGDLVAEVAGVSNFVDRNRGDSFSFVAVGGTDQTTFVGADDFIVIAQDRPSEIDVLANDTNVFGLALPAGVTYSIESGPTSGGALFQNGKILYTPRPGFRGVDTLRYRLRNGNETQVVTLTMVVGNRI